MMRFQPKLLEYVPATHFSHMEEFVAPGEKTFRMVLSGYIPWYFDVISRKLARSYRPRAEENVPAWQRVQYAADDAPVNI